MTAHISPIAISTSRIRLIVIVVITTSAKMTVKKTETKEKWRRRKVGETNTSISRKVNKIDWYKIV